MTSRNCRSQCPRHLFESAACNDPCDLFARFRDRPLSWYAWGLEESSPPPAVLAYCYARPLSRAQNLGRTRPLDASRGNVVALAACAQGNLLGRPCIGGLVGADGPEHLAAP